MLSELNSRSSFGRGNGRRSSGSELYLKRVFSNISNHNDNIKNAFSYINANLPMGPIRIIDVYLTSIDKFLDESNDISKTTGDLENIKSLLSDFSAHIGNYKTRIQGFLIDPLNLLTKIEYTLELMKTASYIGNRILSRIRELRSLGYNVSQLRRNIGHYTERILDILILPLNVLSNIHSNISRINNSRNAIYSKYQKIKPKIEYCKSSLEFELQRLDSISNNARMLQYQLESLIAMLNKYQSNVKKLQEFRAKLETLKKNKKIIMDYLSRTVRMVICNLYDIERISNSLNSGKDRVRITTIKQDIAHINSSIKDINNILSIIKSSLIMLDPIKLGIDCKLLSEIECRIKEIVTGIHGKYCSLSSIITQIDNGVPGVTATSVCQLSKTLQCGCAGQKCAQACERCQDCQGSQACQCCDSLKKILDSTTTGQSKIEEKLKCIKKIICKLIDGKAVDGFSSSGNQECSHVCETGHPQASNTCDTTTRGQQTDNTCQESTNRQMIECSLKEIDKCQSSLQLTCQIDKKNDCETIQSVTATSCSPASTPSVLSCNELDKVKLCVDTVINNCNCYHLKKMLNAEKMKSCVDLFKLLMITNFRELFCLYIGFDKSILDQISCSLNKLEEMKLYLTIIAFIHGEINCWIDCIKDGINESVKKVGGLENTMKSGIRELECAIEGVPRNLVRFSLHYSINNSTLEVINNIDLDKLDNQGFDNNNTFLED